MSARGLTLVELCVGLVAATVIGAASAGMLKAGIMTYTHSVRQDEALTRMRKAVGGEGSAAGILREGRPSAYVSTLDPASVVVLSTSAAAAAFSVSGGSLYRTKDGTTSLHAEKIKSITVNYYNLDSSGLIIESTSAASARLVTAQVTVGAVNAKQKDYNLFSGALLRNHP